MRTRVESLQPIRAELVALDPATLVARGAWTASQVLAHELEEKRRTGLAERQESARHILDLEGRLRALEAKVKPRLLVGGR